MNHLKGRDIDILWLMFRYAVLVNEFTAPDGELWRSYRYADGDKVVNFVHHTKTNLVNVHQPGVCLFEKWFKTNDAKTAWEQV